MLLLDENLHVVGSPLIWEILQGFNQARDSLYFVKYGVVLPHHPTTEQLLMLF